MLGYLGYVLTNLFYRTPFGHPTYRRWVLDRYPPFQAHLLSLRELVNSGPRRRPLLFVSRRFCEDYEAWLHVHARFANRDGDLMFKGIPLLDIPTMPYRWGAAINKMEGL